MFNYYVVAAILILISVLYMKSKNSQKQQEKQPTKSSDSIEEQPEEQVDDNSQNSRSESNHQSEPPMMDIEDLGKSLIPKTRKRMKKENWTPLSESEIELHQNQLEQMEQEKFGKKIRDSGIDFSRMETTVFQMNIGLYCNQACSHCHVDSSPLRKEMMSKSIVDRCVEIIKNSPSVKTVDITGGAPELNKEFRYLVERCSELGVEIIDRCNLTVLLEPYQEDLGDFLASHKVRVIASLPCYLEKNVAGQRGDEVFQRSIRALQMLNKLGYGKDKDLVLDLVYNPTGIHLPPPQAKLQQDYKRVLKDDYNIVFNSLFCITNMPINRFLNALVEDGRLDEYMNLLVDNFNPTSCEAVMCRSYLSVKWDGTVYDCDFNQQINLPPTKPVTVWDITSTNDMLDIKIATRNHCFGCTAGAGSSCQGTTI